MSKDHEKVGALAVRRCCQLEDELARLRELLRLTTEDRDVARAELAHIEQVIASKYDYSPAYSLAERVRDIMEDDG